MGLELEEFHKLVRAGTAVSWEGINKMLKGQDFSRFIDRYYTWLEKKTKEESKDGGGQ